MKQTVVLFFFIVCFMQLHAQTGLPAIDKSPMDMCYYPENYPVLKIRDKVTDPPLARVIYSRPKKEGRAVFGELIPYGGVWRLGANEATEIEFFKPVIIESKKILPGRYTLYALVNEQSWTFIINKETDTWGAFKYDETKDIARTTVTAQALENTVEMLSMKFTKSDTGFNLIVAWENVQASLPMSF